MYYKPVPIILPSLDFIYQHKQSAIVRLLFLYQQTTDCTTMYVHNNYATKVSTYLSPSLTANSSPTYVTGFNFPRTAGVLSIP